MRHWNYADPALDRLGRDWHFSQNDHRLISGLLNDYVAKLGPVW
ncbi:hypothetical protein [Nocardia sp. NRRL S-836]|nr:hypothetical protein [Nocardia sp. NRRL S-836]